MSTTRILKQRRSTFRNGCMSRSASRLLVNVGVDRHKHLHVNQIYESILYRALTKFPKFVILSVGFLVWLPLLATSILQRLKVKGVYRLFDRATILSRTFCQLVGEIQSCPAGNCPFRAVIYSKPCFVKPQSCQPSSLACTTPTAGTQPSFADRKLQHSLSVLRTYIALCSCQMLRC